MFYLLTLGYNTYSLRAFQNIKNAIENNTLVKDMSTSQTSKTNKHYYLINQFHILG
jgi:hypothetical protein